MSKKSLFFWLIFIVAFATFLRFYKLDQFPLGLYHDEAMNGNNALEVLKTGEYKWFYSENNGREGMFINMIAFSINIFGNESWALRGWSALFGALTVLGVYFLTRQITNKERIALFAAFFVAASFWHLIFSRIAFRAIMAPFFSVWSLGLLYYCANLAKSGVQNKKKKILKYLSSVLGGLMLGLGLHTYIAFRAIPALAFIPFMNLLKNSGKKFIAIYVNAH